MTTLALLLVLIGSTSFHSKAQMTWNMVRCGMSNQEAGFTVYADSYGPLLVTDDTPSHGEIRFPAQRDAIGYFHTHPNSLQDRPSLGDIEAAKKSGKYIWVLSRSGLWQVAPSGEVTWLRSKP